MATFAEYAVAPVKQRIVLFEVDMPLEEVEFLPYEAGIWSRKLTYDQADIEASYWYTVYGADCTSDNSAYQNIKSLRVNEVVYTKVSSLAILRNQDKSFVYDRDTSTLYVHFDNHDPARIFDSAIGGVEGFCSAQRKGALDGCYYGDIYYEPRIKGDLSLLLEKDPMEYGIFGFDSIAMEMINADGFFDDFPFRNMFGQPARVLVGFNGLDYDDFEPAFSGIVDTPEYPDFSTAIINCVDTRKVLSRSIPIRRFSRDDYTYLSDNDDGDEKPLAWGVIRNAKCVCLNKEESSASTFTYMFLDTTDHNAGALTTVYADGVEVTPGSSSLSAGTFTLTTAQCDAGKADVTADFTGFSGITNGLDVIKDMLLTYEGITYISDNYDTTEWAAETTDAADIGLYVDKATPMNELIEQICVSLQGNFYIQGDGKRSFRSWDEDRTSSATIEEDEYADEGWEITYPPEEYLSSVKVMYRKDQAEGDYKSTTNTDHQTDAVSRHHTYEQGEVETLLVSESDATALSEAVMSRRKYIRPTCTRTMRTHPTFNIMDFVTATVQRRNGSIIIPESIYEVIGLDKLTGEITLKWVKYSS